MSINDLRELSIMELENKILDLKKELEEGGYSASKSALVKAVLNDLEKKASEFLEELDK